MSRVLCSVCGDVIGVYEPLMAVAAESVRTSSLAREPALGSGLEILAHRACGEDLGLGEGERRRLPAGDWGGHPSSGRPAVAGREVESARCRRRAEQWIRLGVRWAAA
jgi:hypothetical protein